MEVKRVPNFLHKRTSYSQRGEVENLWNQITQMENRLKPKNNFTFTSKRTVSPILNVNSNNGLVNVISTRYSNQSHNFLQSQKLAKSSGQNIFIPIMVSIYPYSPNSEMGHYISACIIKDNTKSSSPRMFVFNDMGIGKPNSNIEEISERQRLRENIDKTIMNYIGSKHNVSSNHIYHYQGPAISNDRGICMMLSLRFLRYAYREFLKEGMTLFKNLNSRRNNKQTAFNNMVGGFFNGSINNTTNLCTIMAQSKAKRLKRTNVHIRKTIPQIARNAGIPNNKIQTNTMKHVNELINRIIKLKLKQKTRVPRKTATNRENIRKQAKKATMRKIRTNFPSNLPTGQKPIKPPPRFPTAVQRQAMKRLKETRAKKREKRMQQFKGGPTFAR